MLNQALIFIKPQALRTEAVKLIRDTLEEKGIEIIASGTLGSDEMNRRKIIDRHYFAISHSAVDIAGRDFQFTPQEEAAFESEYGVSLSDVRGSGRLVNAHEALEHLKGDSVSRLNSLWRSGQNTKLASGLYVSRIENPELYILNGFYPAMKELFTAPGLEVMWFDVQFDPDVLSWFDFRHNLIGATDPAQAVEGSLRRTLLEKWQELGLDVSPSMGKNGIHASAGPVEGLRERVVWLNIQPESDPLGSLLASDGFSGKDLEKLLENQAVSFRDSKGPVFDVTEDIDTRELVNSPLIPA